ncbi:hypothetical protein UFOVP211_47 [uncultured Caudovirales phage]|uniref:HAD-like domain containing protein n=1 Tax=uncultured Caudovirales phage TaxID=2100421 RepID=A0A6J7WKS3_9CAUD|nr:hypothetical protein UFOVP211_47 [uncultured Caudovirales phage]
MPIPKPKKGEHRNEFMQRCMMDHKMVSEYTTSQRYAVCQDVFNTKLAETRISFDYDGTFSTKEGFDMAKKLNEDNNVYIISARSTKTGMLQRAKEAGIPESRVYATGSNQKKIETINRLGISRHYDNNPDVVKELGNIGKKF